MSTLYGKELILDLVQCNEKVCMDSDLRKFVKGLLKVIDMVPFGEIILSHFGHNNENTSGYTFIQLIETSSIVGHVSEKNRSIHLNIFSCKEFNVFHTTAYAVEFFGEASIRSQLLIERVY